MTRLSGPKVGLVLMLSGMFLFALNDAMGKWLVASYGVGQVLLIRSLAALIVLAPFLWVFGLARLFRLERPGLQAMRVVFSSVEVFCFYLAVRDLPLADVMTWWLAAPIYVAALSPLILGERVGPWRWGAVGLGFVGVVIALGPSGAVSPVATGAAIVGTLCFALMLITGRSLRGTPDTALVFWQLVGAAVAGALAAPFAWAPPTPIDWGLLGLLGVVAMGAHFCVNRALKLADASFIAPLQYTLLLWAMMFGWMFFGDIPRVAMVLGAVLIVGSGLALSLSTRAARRMPAAFPDRSG